MPVLTSSIHTSSPEFHENARQMRALLDEVESLYSRVREGGGAEANARHKSRGKLLPRERVARLLDPGSPFLELSPLAAHQVYGEDVPAAGVVAGIGRVNGV